MARQPIEDVIWERVTALLGNRPDVKQYEFGAAIGRGYSWVSAFLSKKRPVTDIALLMRIARYFPVSASYLLGEASQQDDDPKTAVMNELWRRMDDPRRTTLLTVARTLVPPDDEGPPPTTKTGPRAPDAAPGRTRRPREGFAPPAGRKLR